jgi:tetratricopeptide (TPR) repeat protein
MSARWWLLILVACAAVVAAVHWPVLSAGAESFDDRYYVGDEGVAAQPGWESIERLLRGTLRPTGVPGYAHPAAILSLMLDHAIGGRLDNLFAFHRTNLILHVMNTLLVVVLMRRFFGRPMAAAAAGLLYGLHPLTVEPVAWIAQRKAILATWFGLWCLAFYVWHLDRRRWWLYVAALASYGLACMSKPSALPIPALLLVLDYWPLRRLSWRAVWEKASFFVVGGAAGAVAVISHARTLGVTILPGASVLRVGLVVCDKAVFILKKIVWPNDLSGFYPAPSASAVDEHALACVLVTCLLAALVVGSAWRTRAVLGGVMFFGVAVSPVLGVLGYSWIYFQDCYVYLPLVGLVLVVAWLGSAAAGPATGGGRGRWAGCCFAVVVLAVAAAEARGTRAYLRQWQGRTDLYRHMLRQHPDEWVLHNNLGAILSEQGLLDEALAEQQRAMELGPVGDDAVRNERGLGVTLARMGRFAEAEEHLYRALQAAPGEIAGRHDYAVRLAQRGRLAEARAQLSAVVQARPEWPEARNNLGNVLSEMGELGLAVAEYAEAVRLRPGYVEARTNLGVTLSDLGRAEEAIEQFNAAIGLDPQNAKGHYRLGDIYLAKGESEKAAEHYREAMRVRPDDWVTQQNLGGALQNLGRYGEASEAHRKATELNPRSADCWFGLGYDLEMLGQAEAARAAYQKAVAIEPGHSQAAQRLAALSRGGGGGR